jgi:hypothetical protein
LTSFHRHSLGSYILRQVPTLWIWILLQLLLLNTTSYLT